MQPTIACPDDSVSLLEQYDHAMVFPSPARHDASFCDVFVAFLSSLGITHAFGLVGGPIAPFAESLLHSPINVIHCRHEGGAAFAAAEAYFASGRPSLLFTTTGPGFFNALTGIAASRWDGAKVIVVSAATSPAQRGRWSAQETSGHTMPVAGLYSAGPLFHYALQMEDSVELQQVATRLRAGVARPQGFVAHVALPISLQTSVAPPSFSTPQFSFDAPGASAQSASHCATLMAGKKVGLWVGFGARHASASVRELAQRLGCGVLLSPRAKGIFPEDHPQFVGVTGLGGHASVETYMSQEKPDCLMVLGSRLGESTSYWSQRLVPPGGFIHVDIDPDVPGAAYPAAKTVAVQAEIGAFIKALLPLLPAAPVARHAPIVESARQAVLVPHERGPVRPEYIMQSVQNIFINNSDFPIMTESGNAFAWGNHCLRFRTPGRYRASIHYGSMGHFVCGVVGAALGRGGKAVAIVGDGSMLMNNEVSTAVRYGANAVWIVLNDSQYGMVEQGMRALGFSPVETGLPDTDFAAMARAMGARGVRVHNETDLVDALELAGEVHGPIVIDVIIDRDAASPLLQRIESLIEQGARSGRGGT